MRMILATLLVATGLGASEVSFAQVESKVPEFLPRFAFDVLNKEATGRSIIHLEHLVGPDAKTVSGTKPAKTVLVLVLGFDCTSCALDWETLDQGHRVAQKNGARVIGVIWSDESRKQEIQKAKKVVSHPATLAWDAFRLVRTRLGLTGRGSALIIRGDGTVDGRFASAKSEPEPLLKAFSQAIKEGG